MIELKNVSKSYFPGTPAIIRDLSLHVKKGETMALLGASGCGKTTTLKLINRLIDFSAGEIFVNGRPVLDQDPFQLRLSISYVFQEIGLFPHMTVFENIAIRPRLLGWPPEKVSARVHELMDLTRLPPDEFTQRFPKEMSGGQQQRVGIARALAGRPQVMLMDEPFGALDPLPATHCGKNTEKFTRLFN